MNSSAFRLQVRFGPSLIGLQIADCCLSRDQGVVQLVDLHRQPLELAELGQGAAAVCELQHGAVESLDLQQQQLGVLAGLDGDLLGGLTQP